MSEQPESAQPHTPTANSSRTLSIIAISLASLMVILIALVFWRMISFGRDVATSHTSSQSPSASPQAATTNATDSAEAASMTLQDGRQKLQTLTDDSLCQGESDASFLIEFSRLSEEANQWAQDKASVNAKLTELPKKCGDTYTQTLANRLQSASASGGLAELVASTFSTGSSGTLAKRPAPEGAVDMGSFSDISRNIQCAFDNGQLSCTITQYDYFSDTCQGSPITYSIASNSTSSQACGGGIASENVVAYGTTVAHDGLACTVTQQGVECWHEGNGTGFKLSRSGISTF